MLFRRAEVGTGASTPTLARANNRHTRSAGQLHRLSPTHVLLPVLVLGTGPCRPDMMAEISSDDFLAVCFHQLPSGMASPARESELPLRRMCTAADPPTRHSIPLPVGSIPRCPRLRGNSDCPPMGCLTSHLFVTVRAPLSAVHTAPHSRAVRHPSSVRACRPHRCTKSAWSVGVRATPLGPTIRRRRGQQAPWGFARHAPNDIMLRRRLQIGAQGATATARPGTVTCPGFRGAGTVSHIGPQPQPVTHTRKCASRGCDRSR